MARQVHVEYTVTCNTGEEYDILLAEISGNPIWAIVSQNPTTYAAGWSGDYAVG